jgi:hypothetical protein
MTKNLKFIPRDNRDHSTPAVSLRRFRRIKGKSLKNILIDKFLNQYGYDKGIVTANAIVHDLLSTIEHYYRYTDNSFIKQGQMVWHAVPVDEYPSKAKSMEQTKLKPVVLDIIADDDIDAIKDNLHHREIRIKKIERWTSQAYEQGAVLSQLDLAVLLGTHEHTAGQYVREYYSLYGRHLPTRGHIQQIGSGQTHKKQIISLYLKGYLTPYICQRTNHSKDAVERYLRDYEAVALLYPKFNDIKTISLITRLSTSVVNQYIDLMPNNV